MASSSTVDSSVSDLFSSAPALQSNLGILSPDQVCVDMFCVATCYYSIVILMLLIWFGLQIELAKILLENGQSHLFLHWSEPGVCDNEKLGFFDQVLFLLIFVN